MGRLAMFARGHQCATQILAWLQPNAVHASGATDGHACMRMNGSDQSSIRNIRNRQYLSESFALTPQMIQRDIRLPYIHLSEIDRIR